MDALTCLTRRVVEGDLLSGGDMKQIYEAVLDVIAEVGVRVGHQEALCIYPDNGCDVDFERQVVAMPRQRCLQE